MEDEQFFCQHGEIGYCEPCDDDDHDIRRSVGPVPAAPPDAERVAVDTFFVDPADPLVAVLIVAGDEVPARLAGRKRRPVTAGRAKARGVAPKKTSAKTPTNPGIY